MQYPSREKVAALKKFVMSISSIVIFTFICWWVCCAYNFAIVSSNINNKGLFPNAPVKDFNDGSLMSLFSWIHKHSVTLVFFYAPWSGQCIKVSPVIFSVHKRLNNPVVTIAAINCWVGGCREKFPTFRFPRVFLYHSTYLPIEYFGDIETDEIVQFVQLSLTPWTYIASSNELKTFIESYDYYFVAYMNHQKVENDEIYESFYHSTLLLINKPNRPQVAMVTNEKLASMLQLTEHGQIRSQSLHPVNMYSTKLNYTADAISRWMTRRSNKVVRVLKPHHDKDSYVKALKKGPAVILHSSLSAVENGVIQQYLNIALSYHTCQKTVAPKKLHSNDICRSFLTDSNVCSVCQVCSQFPCLDQTWVRFSKMENYDQQGGICSSSILTTYFNEQKYSICCLNDRKGKTIKRPSAYLLSTKRTRMLSQVSIILRYRQEFYANITIEMQIISDHSQEAKAKESPLSALLNKFVALENEVKLKCGNITRNRECPLEEYFVRNTNSMIQGLACHTNRSLNFFLLDYNKNKYVLNEIGIAHDPALLIVDLAKDELYMLTEQITLRSMASFILQFNLGLLEQGYLTQPEVKQPQTSNIKIAELTSLTFEDVAMTEGKNVFVMFYATWCGVCKAINLLFLKLVHLYKGEVDVIFARIDSDTHELPWHYKANVYPSFILFPAYRKSYSVSFPSNQDITLESLKQFLDDNVETSF